MDFAVNYWAVLVAALAPFFVGWIWYSPALFGNTWMQLKGIKPSEMSRKEGMKYMFMGFFIQLVMAFLMASFALTLGISQWLNGLVLGVVVWFGFIFTTFLRAKMYGKTSTKLFAIDNGYMLLEFALMGALVTVNF